MGRLTTFLRRHFAHRGISPSLALAAAMGLLSTTCLAQTPGDQNFIRSLDKAFRPRFLDTSNPHKLPDGSYSKLVTTGDAVVKPSIDFPLKALRTACSEPGYALRLQISAGRPINGIVAAQVTIGEEHFELNRDSMWTLFGGFSDEISSRTAKSGFAALFMGSPFAERAARDADADPPFGLFTCESGDRVTLWAAVIMPMQNIARYDLEARLTPITPAWIRNYDGARAAADGRAREREAARIAALAHARDEESRLKPFRDALIIGSRTNCGMVIDIRGPLVQVQLPPDIRGAGDQREFWARRDELTDASPPDGCSFGR